MAKGKDESAKPWDVAELRQGTVTATQLREHAARAGVAVEGATYEADGTEKRTRATMNAFLGAFSICKTKTTAARAAGIVRETVYDWERNDVFGFAKHLRFAAEVYTDGLEDKLTELALGLKPGQNALAIIAKVNAELPEKYRSNAVPADERPEQFMEGMIAWRREERLRAKAVADEQAALGEGTEHGGSTTGA